MQSYRESRRVRAVQESGKIHGWIGDGEAGLLYDSSFDSTGNVLEVGGYMGKSTFLMASAIKDSGRRNVVVSIDIHKKSFESDEILTPESILKINEMINKQCLSRWIVQLIGWSHTCLPLIDFYDIDTIFIDGGHRYETCRRDLEIVLERIRRDRTITMMIHDMMIHDYHQNDAPGVVKAVQDLLISNPRFSFVRMVERTFVCRLGVI